jgi:hypothetical protein
MTLLADIGDPAGRALEIVQRPRQVVYQFERVGIPAT